MKTANSKTIDTRVTKKKDNKETRSVIKSSKDSLMEASVNAKSILIYNNDLDIYVPQDKISLNQFVMLDNKSLHHFPGPLPHHPIAPRSKINK
jgi:hypothetical protein